MGTDRLFKLIIITFLITLAVAIGVGGAASAANTSSFDVAITDINTSVVEGETVVVEAKITNTGSEEDSEQIHLKQNDSIVDSVKNPSVTLAPGESTTEMLQWTPEYGDTGPAELAVWSDDHEAVRTVDVGEGPTFPVAIDSTSGPIVGGESLTLSVTVRNTGETTETVPAELFVSDELQAQKTVELASAEAKQIDLTWETTENDTGARTIKVVSADTTAESRVRIFDSKEVTSTDAATEATGNEAEDTEAAGNEAEGTEATGNEAEDTEAAGNEAEDTEATGNEAENTDAAVNKEQNTGLIEILDPSFGVTVALLALLAIALLGYALYRN